MAKIAQFVKDSIQELQKVSWPSKEEVIQATFATGVFVAVFSLILFGVDLGVRYILQGMMK
ncbi:MAG: preprotein translocase subunit SecE [Brevinemataceae bacterium]